MKGLSIVVTGSRAFCDANRVNEVLAAVHSRFRIRSLAQGGASGLDALAKHWATVIARVPCRTYEADWVRRGAAAGPVRNRLMLRVERPDVVLVFAGGRGTEDCATAAVEMGWHVVRVTGLKDEEIAAQIAEALGGERAGDFTTGWVCEEQPAAPRCKHGEHDCDKCGQRPADQAHTTLQGKGKVGRIPRIRNNR